MAWTFTAEANQAACDGLCTVFENVRLDTSGDSELATLPVTWGGATAATPSVNTGTATADASPTAGTIAKLKLLEGATLRASCSVGLVGSGADIEVADTVIPGDATSVEIPGGVELSLTLA